MNPFFSIVIPSYNRAELLPETIDSILKQEFKDFEIIIIDDGSEDNTEEVIQKKYAKEIRLQYIWTENGERGLARNNGFRKSSGEYVLFFDSDDFMLSNHLSTLKKYIDSLDSPNFIATKHFLKSEKGHVIYNSSKDLKQGWYNYSALIDGNWLACHFCVKRSNPNLILFEEDRQYAILEDWMFLIMNLHGDKIFLIDEFTIQQRIHDGRSMNNNKLIIERRDRATNYLIDRVNFSEAEKKQIQTQSFYFCAIHAYLDKNSKQAKSFLKKAYSLGGISKGVIILYLKLTLGYYPKNI